MLAKAAISSSTDRFRRPLSQVLNGMAVTLSGTPAERAAALARLKALPQVTRTCEDLI